ncbi:YihY/virulence factor BrkB family protein [Lacihabitans sp. CCS-44]|uniref:YihY/virulence factor BrkB family protein n=1 Tax=Lacihabitans sp. CCS-44 TaxID=2487331 RepID=UPI0020CE56DE|nr:YihY/virulence factor BrkB family protein [Lacihabitans sp. CCS-44]MCP9754265.1 YihY/virulence factor BrkB family protein [Lacihabitans sp. CCS-44]
MNKKIENIVNLISERLKSVYIFNTTVSLYIFITILYKKIVNFDLDQRAAAVSFSFMLAVFPGTIFLFTLIPYIPIQNLEVLIMDFLKNLMPEGLYESVSNTIQEIISRPRLDILSFGFAFAIFAATNGMSSLMRAFNMALKQREKRSYIKARWIAFLLTSLLIVVLLTAIIVLIVGKITLNYITRKEFVGQNINIWGINILGYASIFIIFFFGISCIYYFAPAMHKKLKFFNFGALFASILSILATNLFSFYLENFNSYNRLYGSIGTLIAIMVWIYLIALILILGFELNISFLSAANRSKQKTP